MQERRLRHTPWHKSLRFHGNDADRSCRLQRGFQRMSDHNLPGAGGHEQNVIRLHGNVRRLGLKNLLQVNRAFSHSLRSFPNNFRSAELGSVICSTSQCNGLKNRNASPIHQKPAGPSHIPNYVHDVGSAHNDGVPRKYWNIAFRVVGNVPAQCDLYRLIRLAPMVTVMLLPALSVRPPAFEIRSKSLCSPNTG